MTRPLWIARAVLGELRVALMLAVQYRASFLGEALMAVLWVPYTLLPLFVVYGREQGLAGWTRDEALLVLGFWTTLEGLLSAFVSPNLSAVVEQVRSGSFDFVLLKPVDPQLLVSVHRTDPTQLPHALVGLLLVGFAAGRLPVPPGPQDWLLGALLLGCGVVILHALWTVVVATAFWFVRVDNLSALLNALVDAGRWPIQVYPQAVRFVFKFVLPVGLMTTWPAMALRRLLDPGQVLLALAVTLGFLLLGRAVWRLALRHYASASS